MMHSLGPVSQLCADKVRELARQHGIVVWLDADDQYSALVDELGVRHEAGSFDVSIVAYRGSYLETMLALEGKADGVDPVPLIVHAPGLNEESIRQTPLLELYRAGRRHRHKLVTAISEAAHERAKPGDIEEFVQRGDLSLEAADEWLANYGQGNQRLGPDLSAFGAQALFEELRVEGELAKMIDEPHALDAIWERAGQLLGITPDWRPEEHRGPKGTPAERASTVRSEIASFCMCVEFVDDLKRPPMDEWLKPLGKLAVPFRRTARDLAAHIRRTSPEKYARWADEVEHTLERESKGATAEDLGKVDTFRFEDERIIKAAIAALVNEDFATALSWSSLRTDGRSFWTQRNSSRRLAWQVIELSAHLGQAVGASSGLLDGCKSLDDAGEAYAASGYMVDRFHRRLEQGWKNSPELVKLDEFALLRSAVESMRKVYRGWLDGLCESFNALCEASGFLPDSSLQQRSIFRDVVQPWANEEPTAYFLVDGLRYEMGLQLAEAMGRSEKVEVHVKPRMAELPTITSVGMNVLAPVSEGGTLRAELTSKGAFKGFRAGTMLVSNPESRTKAMRQAVGGATCTSKSLEEINTMDMVNLKRSTARSKLVIVHCEGIDKAGEKGVGLVVFERELQHIRSAWSRLHEAGIRRFVITADHGFLLHDPVTRKPVRHGNQVTPKRRHIVSEMVSSGKFETHVSSTALGYDDVNRYFVFPRTGSPFDLGERAKDFVHGGNSPQERIIPVITVQYRHQSGVDVARYVFETEVCPQSGNMHHLRLRVRQEGQVSLRYAARKSVEVILECADVRAGQVEILDVTGGEHTGAAISIPPEESCEVFFRIVSEKGKRARVRVAHATGSQSFEPLVLTEWFDSEAVRQQQDASIPAPPTPPPSQDGEAEWLSAFEDEGIRRFFGHLAEYGSLNESEAINMLGSPRKLRKFSRKLEDYVRALPFRVVVETSSAGKCYVRKEE